MAPADDNAITFACSYAAECYPGYASWSICVRDVDGMLRYRAWSSSQKLETQTTVDALASLTR